MFTAYADNTVVHIKNLFQNPIRFGTDRPKSGLRISFPLKFKFVGFAEPVFPKRKFWNSLKKYKRGAAAHTPVFAVLDMPEFGPDKLKFEKDGLKFFTGAEKAVTGGVFPRLNAWVL
jgi:hypothetical protein